MLPPSPKPSFTAEPLSCGLLFHSDLDNAMTQLIINMRADALTSSCGENTGFKVSWWKTWNFRQNESGLSGGVIRVGEITLSVCLGFPGRRPHFFPCKPSGFTPGRVKPPTLINLFPEHLSVIAIEVVPGCRVTLPMNFCLETWAIFCPSARINPLSNLV